MSAKLRTAAKKGNPVDANKTIRPEEHLRAVSKKYLLAWQQLAMFRAERGKDDLPGWWLRLSWV